MQKQAKKKRCSSDRAWANFVSVTADDIHNSMKVDPASAPGRSRSMNDMSIAEVEEFERSNGVVMRKQLRMSVRRIRSKRKGL